MLFRKAARRKAGRRMNGRRWALQNRMARCKTRLTVALDNQGDSLTAVVQGWRAGQWAASDQTIGGSGWELADGRLHSTPRSRLAYAMPGDYPGLAEELRKEGYRLDLSCYSEPEEGEEETEEETD